MSVTTSSEPAVEPRVRDFLRQEAAEGDFQIVCKLARRCFPEHVSLEVQLSQDPDEEKRERVVLSVTVPATHPLDLLGRQLRQYHESLVQEVSLARCPLFVLLIDFAQD